jgi:2-succinyl-6-hydroxy-2,4-cyclohexadiene-1-carboxylate synthase
MRVVFVPGFTQTAASWRPVIDGSFRDAPFEPLALDITDGLDFAATASAIGDIGGNAAYVGYSLGGRLCLQLALDRSELVERLVLVSASPGIADPEERAARRAADEGLAREVEHDGVDAFLERWLTQPMFATLPPELSGLDERRRANTSERISHQLRALGHGAQPSNWDRLGELRMPVLLVVGALDRKYVEIARQMAAAIRDVTLEVVPDTGHACHLEQPDAVAHALASWSA